MEVEFGVLELEVLWECQDILPACAPALALSPKYQIGQGNTGLSQMNSVEFSTCCPFLSSFAPPGLFAYWFIRVLFYLSLPSTFARVVSVFTNAVHASFILLVMAPEQQVRPDKYKRIRSIICKLPSCQRAFLHITRSYWANQSRSFLVRFGDSAPRCRFCTAIDSSTPIIGPWKTYHWVSKQTNCRQSVASGRAWPARHEVVESLHETQACEWRWRRRNFASGTGGSESVCVSAPWLCLGVWKWWIWELYEDSQDQLEGC